MVYQIASESRFRRSFIAKLRACGIDHYSVKSENITPDQTPKSCPKTDLKTKKTVVYSTSDSLQHVKQPLVSRYAVEYERNRMG